MLNSKGDKGRLLQIRTGEGKSSIVSVIAAYKSIHGCKVDIVTSNEVLARRDADKNGLLY